jgi:hypothetical protein
MPCACGRTRTSSRSTTTSSRTLFGAASLPVAALNLGVPKLCKALSSRSVSPAEGFPSFPSLKHRSAPSDSTAILTPIRKSTAVRRRPFSWSPSRALPNSSGAAIRPGALGENLTTRGLDRRFFRIGQQFRAGSAMLEITSPRGPCVTLDVYGASLKREIKAEDASSPVWGLSGFYARVLSPGFVRADDIITLVATLA